jgi:hypothetical protein
MMAENQNIGMNKAAIARQRHGKQMSVATSKQTTTEELLGAVFSMQSVLRLCSEDNQEEGSQNHPTVKYHHESCGTWNQESLCWRGPAAI